MTTLTIKKLSWDDEYPRRIANGLLDNFPNRLASVDILLVRVGEAIREWACWVWSC